MDDFVRNLRKNPTPAEAVLWSFLRRKQIGGKRIQRQFRICYQQNNNGFQSNFIADFCCCAVKLVIEIDGKIHEQQTEYDAQRTAILNELGYSVIRFKNEEVFENIEKVLKSISDAISSRLV